MKLIHEYVNPTEILLESVSDTAEKRLYITGPFLMHSKQNQNGRIYSKKGMDKAVKEYTEQYIKTNRAMGELKHPKGEMSVDPERACILTTDLQPDGNYYHGKAKVLSTPLGKILEALLLDGVRIGVSSRGYGSTSKRGDITHVGDDYTLKVAADVVTDPSVADAFVQHLMEEREYILVNGVFVEEDVFNEQQRIKSASLANLQTAKLMAFESFLNKIKTNTK